MNSSRARRATRKPLPIEAALAAVQVGGVPEVNGGEDYGTTAIEDPYEKAPDGRRPVKRIKVVALRDDPIGRMFKRGQLKRVGDRNELLDRDDIDAELRLKAARVWQIIYEAAEIGGARAIDFTRDVVDGGQLAQPDTDHRLASQLRLMQIDNALGKDGRTLVRRILGEKLEIAAVATMIGRPSQMGRKFIGWAFLNCLDVLAGELGIIPLRPAPGPRRKPDEWDKLAPHAHQPRLVEAMRLAKAQR